MKHAGTDTLALLSELLVELRQRTILKEKSVRIFYLRSVAFLHFHDDPAGIFADVKLDPNGYSRVSVTTRAEQKALLRKIDQRLETFKR
jgi:hypothetical protein